jgi:hypothetical protein
MAGADNTLTVDGVEPSIPVTLLDIADNPERVQLYTADDGTERFIVKGAEATLAVPGELGNLGTVSVEIEYPNIPSTPSAPAPNLAAGVIANVSSSPGQSG